MQHSGMASTFRKTIQQVTRKNFTSLTATYMTVFKLQEEQPTITLCVYYYVLQPLLIHEMLGHSGVVKDSKCLCGFTQNISFLTRLVNQM